MEAFLKEKLNPQQFDAAKTVDGPLLILAGAGSGKTRVLTYRIANIVASGKAQAHEILAVTFTNKAAKEMESRVNGILNDLGVPLFEKLWVSTFHATCVRILRDHIELMGYRRGFTIYDSSDQISLIKKISANMGLKEKEFPAKNFQSRIRWAKMEGIRPEEIKNKKNFKMDERALAMYTAYEEEMFRANALDFDDLLLKTLHLFEQFPKVLQAYQRRFRYIMVDEYQDTNHTQYNIVLKLASLHKNLCVVGDEDQSIYSWRGADITNILNFESDFPNAFVVKLEENYRSTQTIVNAATDVISNNSQRKGKTLFSNNDEGDKILVKEESDDREEAAFVAREIMRISKSNPLKDISIFYRNNSQSRSVEDQLRANSIPYKVIGGLRFYDRMEIKDALGYLRLLLNPNDDVAFKRIVNVPTRGIGKTTIEKIQGMAAERTISMLEATHHCIVEKYVNSGAAKKLTNFLTLIASMKEDILDLPPSEALHHVLQESEYIKKYELEDTPEAQARIDNLEELSNAMIQFEKDFGEEASLQRFLEDMALVSDLDNMDENEDAVHLMTLHISKGLEFPYVFIVGMEENIFPSAQSIESEDDESIEEERRIAYVGYTRAMKNLYLLHARSRRVWGQMQYNAPSRFLDEIPEKYKSDSSKFSQPNFAREQKRKSKFRDSMNSYANAEDVSTTKTWAEENFDEMPDYDNDISPWKSSGGDSSQSFQKGNRVRHPQFGPGTVYAVKGDGEKAKITVIFEGNFLKNFVAKVEKLERL
ncbi:MAG: ATP-dependent helicase [Bdellovibrionales bacterium]